MARGGLSANSCGRKEGRKRGREGGRGEGREGRKEVRNHKQDTSSKA